MPARQRSKSSARQRDIRGNTRDRLARRQWLLQTFDVDLGDALARCALGLSPECLKVVDAVSLTVDRIKPGGQYTRDNIQPACGPCQSWQGGVIGPERARRCSDE